MSRATSRPFSWKPAPAQASAARPIPAALSSRLRISVKYALIVASTKCASVGVNSFADATQASRSAELSGLTFKREGSKDDLKTRPMVEISGHASDKLKDSIQQGRLLHIELINYKEKNLGFDEAKFISSVRRDMSLSIAKALPQGNALKFLEKVKEYAKKNDYEAMRVRWREPQAAKAHTAKVDTARSDAGEALFVKFAEIKLRQPLPDICDTMSDELISKIKDFVG